MAELALDDASRSLTDLAGQIVMAYVTRNALPAAELPRLIVMAHAALSELTGRVATVNARDATALPDRANVRKSVRPDGLISFIDGKTYKTLKRHLAKHGLTPTAYRIKFDLPLDYPMTCTELSRARATLAKGIRLGQSQRDAGKAVSSHVARDRGRSASQ